MALVADAISWICLLSGVALMLIGGIGLLRLPDVFTRMHGAGMIDTLGLGLILVGLMFQAGLTLVTAKLFLIVVFVLFTSPTTTHALARACLHGGVRPLLDAPTSEKDPDGGTSSKT